MNRAFARLAPIALGAALLASCAETTVDLDGADGGAEVEVTGEDADRATSSTLPISGTAAELLAELSAEMSQLSSQVAGDGEDQETLRRIDAIWVVARPEVESTRPELVSGIDTSVEMARTAVVRIRPADADKAFSILSDLVDRYTGDG